MFLLIFDNSYEDICNWKVFVDIAPAGRQCGLKNFSVKHNLLQQSKLRRDVELQSLYFVLFKSHRDVRQISMLITQLEVGSGVVD